MLQSEAFFSCPYCGEPISMLIDHSVPVQSYIEDCEVCCQPIFITCEIDGDSVLVEARRSDE